jgi:NitT/TauT family transport system permease protein/taurine transport system permease protein
MASATAVSRPRRLAVGTRLARLRWLRPAVRSSAAFVVLGMVWVAVAPFVSSYALPAPSSVLARFGEDLRVGILPTYVGESVRHLLISAVVGIAVGVPFGLVIGFSRRVSNFCYPLLSFFQALSGIAWLPMIVVWFGFNEVTIVAATNYAVFFPIVFNTMVGVRSVPPVYARAVRTMGGNQWRVVRDVLAPGALPNIVTGIRLGIAYGWRALIAAEMLTGANGLGSMIFTAQAQSDTTTIVAGMLVIGALWLLLDQLFLRPFEVVTVQRWGLMRQ